MSPDIQHSVREIGKAIMQHDDSYLSHRKKNQRFDLKRENQICFLIKGCVSAYRLKDNILTLSLNAPAILGLAQMRSDKATHYMRCNEDCEMWLLDADHAVSMFDILNMWRHAFDILTKHVYLYHDRETMINQPNVKSVVLEHIKLLWGMEADQREKTSIYTYVLSRNIVSRSAVHKAIQELEADGVVKVTRGKLLELAEVF